MTIRSTTGRALVATVALLLVAGTTLAVGPSGAPSGSPDSSATASAPASTSTSPSVSPSSIASPKSAATAPAKSEAPEKAEAPETETHDSDGPPSADQVARIVGLLKDAGITATAAQVTDLAAKVGVGGAVRVLAFADASGKTPAQILAMHDGGKGWGQIDHELGLSIGPGLGWIMGHGHGQGHAKGPKN